MKVGKLYGLYAGLWVMALFSNSTVHAECTLQSLTPQGSEVHADGLLINLGEADDLSKPTAWQGPLTAGSCHFDIGIIEAPLELAAGRYLYVPVYSGSVRKLKLLDLKTCKIHWQSSGFSGTLKINSQGLELSGKRIGLDGACLPKPGK